MQWERQGVGTSQERGEWRTGMVSVKAVGAKAGEPTVLNRLNLGKYDMEKISSPSLTPCPWPRPHLSLQTYSVWFPITTSDWHVGQIP